MEIVPGLSRITFTKDIGPTSTRSRAPKRLRGLIPLTQKNLPPELTRWVARQRNRGRYSLPPKLRSTEAEITDELLALLGLTKSAMPNAVLLGRLATVGFATRRLGSKVGIG